eukprot:CAMPEP_0119099298 /NCGR_PEP_ID=MMETSP1178-20130426/185022_1 /TAXON_ID=33656 /ORGANISM="unid sp, Strain CCMP2000" /LENGTH=91 /DNA_ID=CAMNT_0007083279 /DNA_START=519 /DNA_END=792 /DNA_ORIENTATION=+
MLAGSRLRISLRDDRENRSVFLIGEFNLVKRIALQAAQSSSRCEDIAAAMHRFAVAIRRYVPEERLARGAALRTSERLKGGQLEPRVRLHV